MNLQTFYNTKNFPRSLTNFEEIRKQILIIVNFRNSSYGIIKILKINLYYIL